MNQLTSDARRIDAKAFAVVGSQPVASFLPLKRALDIVFALFLIALSAPLMLFIAIAIRLESQGPVLFVQQRLGRRGKRFGLLKFRTLRRLPSRQDAQGSVMALSGKDHDITRTGRWLRHTGLNELPQLFNILKGDMSFVGPRPAVLHHEQYYTDWHRKRLALRPGVSGLAQVCGRNAIPWGWRVALDRHYVDHASLWLDALILLKTVWVVGFGIGSEGEEQDYFDFTPPEGDVIAELQRRGVMRTFLHRQV